METQLEELKWNGEVTGNRGEESGGLKVNRVWERGGRGLCKQVLGVMCGSVSKNEEKDVEHCGECIQVVGLETQ